VLNNSLQVIGYLVVLPTPLTDLPNLPFNESQHICKNSIFPSKQLLRIMEGFQLINGSSLGQVKKIQRQGKIGQFLDYNPLISPTKDQRPIYIWLFVNYLMKDSSFDLKN